MIWYPYEQLKTMKAPYEIVDANGVYLYTKDQKMIDSVSSWWSVIHGYKHPVINQAIISQADPRTGEKAVRETGVLAAGGSGLLLLFRFRQCGGGSGVKNGAAVLYESGR